MGGDIPRKYIRINGPFKIMQMVESKKYCNRLLRDVDKRHKRPTTILEDFFETEMSSDERWDYVESYLLSKVEPKECPDDSLLQA